MVNIISAQTLVKENRLWSNTMYGTELEKFYQDTHWIKFFGDTIINDTVFKVIYRSNDEFHDTWYRYGAIREDSSKKIFIHQNSHQSLLYDFNLKVGDSISIHNNSHINYIYVIKVDSVLLENFDGPLKRILLNCYKTDKPEWSYPWIEGIGSTQGILSGAKNVGMLGAVYELVCYYENDTLKYQDNDHSSCFPQGFYKGLDNDFNYENLIKVFHNNEFITFQFKKIGFTNSHLFIYDITGKLIELFEVEGDEKLDIPKDRFHKGFYIYCFKIKERQVVGKFIVE
jgi:hypothetical protein